MTALEYVQKECGVWKKEEILCGLGSEIIMDLMQEYGDLMKRNAAEISPPSEEEICLLSKETRQIANVDFSFSEAYHVGFMEGINWLKSKISDSE